LDRAQLTWNFYCDDCAQKILEGLQEILSGPEVAEETESEKGQEYYVCKECGQKFLKPGELGEYKSHCLHAHKAAK
jgi:DNA-directed RNA polymerase subunit RPC12/RpoP